MSIVDRNCRGVALQMSSHPSVPQSQSHPAPLISGFVAHITTQKKTCSMVTFLGLGDLQTTFLAATVGFPLFIFPPAVPFFSSPRRTAPRGGLRRLQAKRARCTGRSTDHRQQSCIRKPKKICTPPGSSAKQTSSLSRWRLCAGPAPFAEDGNDARTILQANAAGCAGSSPSSLTQRHRQQRQRSQRPLEGFLGVSERTA
ncbi:uncharacterized protein BDZ83DRAFT_106923 [Colletotrichum acutatum]|uniref:Uncharacterized protein n=1 Tax=Glomerella acutata TaxID=27357 RepID=A0AAD8U890_GLOAC|nr:uncharacterized protein BDZ83DRAFT_106923 [Colletotrichum acutatum]KAK1711968.1 hypothetical protein BDZ83DRAFT_106923 [Colletotrichum acutatum]